MAVDLASHRLEVALHALPELTVRLVDVVVGRRVVVADYRRRHLEDAAHRVADPAQRLALEHVLRRRRVRNHVDLARQNLKATNHVGVARGLVHDFLQPELLLVRHAVLVLEESTRPAAAHNGFLISLRLEADRDHAHRRLERRQPALRVVRVVVVEVNRRAHRKDRRSSHRRRAVLHAHDPASRRVALVLDVLARHRHDLRRQRDRRPSVEARRDRLALGVHQEPPVLAGQLPVAHAGRQKVGEAHVAVRHLEQLPDRMVFPDLLRVLVLRFPDADRHLTHGLGQDLNAREDHPRVVERLLHLFAAAKTGPRQADLAKQRVHGLLHAVARRPLENERTAGHTLERCRLALLRHW